MEPNAEILRRKILEAEHQPVPWNKAGVWEKVSDQLPQKNDRIRYYVAIAAVFILLFVSGWIVYTQHQWNEKVNQLEALISEEKSKRLLHEEQSMINNETCEDLMDSPVGINAAQTKAAKTEIANIPHRFEENRASLETTEVMVDEFEIADVPALAENVSQSAPRPEAIIGVYQLEQSFTTENKKRKNRIRFFKTGEKESTDETHQHNIVIARIK